MTTETDEVALIGSAPAGASSPVTSPSHGAKAQPALTFSLEPFSDALLAEMLPLLTAHWREVAHWLDIPLEVDAGVYHAAQSNGALRIFTLRQGPLWSVSSTGESKQMDNGVLIGYAVFFVRANPHYAGSVQAVQDVLYVSPTSRGSTGARLIRAADDALRAEGVQCTYHHSKLAHDFGPLLVRMGYEAVETIYAKRLDRETHHAGAEW